MSDATVPGLVFCIMILVLLASVALLVLTGRPADDETPLERPERASTRKDGRP